MSDIEPVKVEDRSGLTTGIRDFWVRNVNAERLMGVQVSKHKCGTEAYFKELETQRFRSHRHLRPWIESMHQGFSVLEVGSGVGLDTYTMARHGLQVTSIDEVYRVLKPGEQALVMLYRRRSLNEWVHKLAGLPFEERDHVCPVVRRFSLQETRKLFSDFANVEITLAHAFGEGYRVLYRLIPQWLYDFLSRHFGWHIMILATK